MESRPTEIADQNFIDLASAVIMAAIIARPTPTDVLTPKAAEIAVTAAYQLLAERNKRK